MSEAIFTPIEVTVANRRQPEDKVCYDTAWILLFVSGIGPLPDFTQVGQA